MTSGIGPGNWQLREYTQLLSVSEMVCFNLKYSIYYIFLGESLPGSIRTWIHLAQDVITLLLPYVLVMPNPGTLLVYYFCDIFLYLQKGD